MELETAIMGTPDEGVESLLMTWREVPPSHYILKIKSFSSFLNKTGLENYESNVFYVGGHAWKLLVYHVRGEKNKGSGRLSLYLKSMNYSREINALIIFFLYDQLKDKYLSIQDTKVRQFNSGKELGHSRLVLLDFFGDASNGFVVKDSCVFGVEIFVIESSGGKLGEHFRTLREEVSEKAYVWKVEKVSELKETGRYSHQQICIGNFNWKLHIYQNISKARDEYLAICLCLQDHSKLTCGQKMHVQFKLSVTVNDKNNLAKKATRRGSAWFSGIDTGWGFPLFIKWKDVEGRKGDAIEIEVQIMSISMGMEESHDALKGHPVVQGWVANQEE